MQQVFTIIPSVIMSQVPDQLSKRYYTIGEVASMFNVTRSLIRFWAQEHPFFKPYHLPTGELRFTADNIRQFETIYHLIKEKGYTHAGAKKYLAEEKDQLRQKQEALKTLKLLRGFLEEWRMED